MKQTPNVANQTKTHLLHSICIADQAALTQVVVGCLLITDLCLTDGLLGLLCHSIASYCIILMICTLISHLQIIIGVMEISRVFLRAIANENGVHVKSMPARLFPFQRAGHVRHDNGMLQICLHKVCDSKSPNSKPLDPYQYLSRCHESARR